MINVANPRCRRALRIVGLSLAFIGAGGQSRAADDDKKTAIIEGVVTYKPDAQRPWRYSRYYVKDAESGKLAEAVVALRSSKLKGTGKRDKPETVTVDQENFQFVPETVAIRIGDSVKFTNSDSSIHNVRTSGRLASFNVTIATGGSHTVLCDHAGGTRYPIKVGCIFHSSMQGWVYVFDHPHYQLTGEDGRFRLKGVPPGEYDLEMVHPAGALRWRKTVKVQAGETLQVDIAVSPDDKD